MTVRTLARLGRHIVSSLTGDELLTFDHGNDERSITARDLRAYVGGDIAVPAIRCEAGANARRISDFPNADSLMGGTDRITGIRNGQNVNFFRSQILSDRIKGFTVARLPKLSTPGMEAFVVDGLEGLVWGEEVRGGGAYTYKVWFNGRAWTVTGK